MILRTPNGQLKIVSRKNCINETVFNQKIIEIKKMYISLNTNNCAMITSKKNNPNNKIT